jgi:hypothetical protein
LRQDQWIHYVNRSRLLQPCNDLLGGPPYNFFREYGCPLWVGSCLSNNYEFLTVSVA